MAERRNFAGRKSRPIGVFGRESTQSEGPKVSYDVPKAGKTIYKAPKVLLDVYVAIRSRNNLVVIPVVSNQFKIRCEKA